MPLHAHAKVDPRVVQAWHSLSLMGPCIQTSGGHEAYMVEGRREAFACCEVHKMRRRLLEQSLRGSRRCTKHARMPACMRQQYALSEDGGAEAHPVVGECSGPGCTLARGGRFKHEPTRCGGPCMAASSKTHVRFISVARLVHA